MLATVTVVASIFWIIYADQLDFIWQMFLVYFVVALFGWFTIHEMDMFLTNKKARKRFNEDNYVVASAIIYSDIFLLFVAVFAIFSTSPEESE